MNKFLEKLNKIQDNLNLQKKYPHVFTNGFKWFLRGVFILWLLMWAFFFWQNDFSFSTAYVECPSDAHGQCTNPFYDQSKYMTHGQIEQYCQEGLCDKEFLSPGEVAGRKPKYVYSSNYDFLFIGMIIFAFIFQIRTKTQKEIKSHDW